MWNTVSRYLFALTLFFLKPYHPGLTGTFKKQQQQAFYKFSIPIFIGIHILISPIFAVHFNLTIKCKLFRTFVKKVRQL
jgi:hypothetical protein